MLDNYSDVAPAIIARGTILAQKNMTSKGATTIKPTVQLNGQTTTSFNCELSLGVT